jgi:hypothetical protein
VEASTSRNPKGVHGQYRDKFTFMGRLPQITVLRTNLSRQKLFHVIQISVDILLKASERTTPPDRQILDAAILHFKPTSIHQQSLFTQLLMSLKRNETNQCHTFPSPFSIKEKNTRRLQNINKQPVCIITCYFYLLQLGLHPVAVVLP